MPPASGSRGASETDESRGTRLVLRLEPAGETRSRAKCLFQGLRRQFRAAMRALTRPSPEPEMKPRRRREETGRGFRAFAIRLLRRVSRTPVYDPLDPSWDSFTWLQLWEYNTSASHLDCVPLAGPAPSGPHV